MCVNVSAGYKAIVSVLYVVDCGSPELPSNAAVLAAAEGTDGSTNTEGATVIFTLSHPINITCTRIGNSGQWSPDPAAVQCELAWVANVI